MYPQNSVNNVDAPTLNIERRYPPRYSIFWPLFFLSNNIFETNISNWNTVWLIQVLFLSYKMC